MSVKDNTPEGDRARAEKAFRKQIVREAQGFERERQEKARLAAIDEKTARLKALRMERDAEAAAAKKAQDR